MTLPHTSQREIDTIRQVPPRLQSLSSPAQLLIYLGTMPSFLSQRKKCPEVSLLLFQGILSHCILIHSLLLKDFAFTITHFLFCSMFSLSAELYPLVYKYALISSLSKHDGKTLTWPPHPLLRFAGGIVSSPSPSSPPPLSSTHPNQVYAHSTPLKQL